MLNQSTIQTVIHCLTVIAVVWLLRGRLSGLRFKTKLIEVEALYSHQRKQ